MARPLPSAPLGCYDSGLVPAPREAGSMVPKGHEDGRTARLPHCDHAGRAEVRARTGTPRYAQVRACTFSPSPPLPRLSPAGPALARAVSLSPHVPGSLVRQSVSCALVLWDPVLLRGGSVPSPPEVRAGPAGPPSDDPVRPPSGHQQTSVGLPPRTTLSLGRHSGGQTLRQPQPTRT